MFLKDQLGNQIENDFAKNTLTHKICVLPWTKNVYVAKMSNLGLFLNGIFYISLISAS